MRAVENWFLGHLHILRRSLQLGTLVLFLVIPLLNRKGIHVLMGTLYSLKVGGLDIADPALALQTMLLLKEWLLPLAIGAAIPLVLAALLGKVFCSWMCPFNFLAELGQGAKRKLLRITGRRIRHNPAPIYFWVVFGLFVLAALITARPLLTYFSMPGQISALLADLLFHHTLAVEWLLVLVILAAEVVPVRRWWCRSVCPVGAMLAVSSSRHRLRVAYDPRKCNCAPGHFPCIDACPLDLNPRQKGIYPSCYNCGECVMACHYEGRALTFQFGEEASAKLVAHSGQRINKVEVLGNGRGEGEKNTPPVS